MSEEALEVEFVPDEQPEAQVETPEVIPPEDGIAELKRQLEAERAERIRAQQQLQQANREAYQAKNEAHDTNLQLVVSAIETVSRDLELLSQAHTAALQNGDYDRATKIQREMSAHEAQLLQLNNGRDAMQNAPRPAEPVAAPADPVEALASQLTPRSADWIRRHPECVRDSRMNAKMIAAHNLAVADGIPVDSDEYFDVIESTLKLKAAPANTTADTDDAYAAKVVQRRDAQPAAAPANRSSPTSRTNVVRLSSAQREMAEMMGMKPEEYAKNLIALKKEGKIQ